MQKCQRNRLPIRTNSFCNKFPKLTLRIVSEVIKCFLRELNGSVCYKYIKEELNQSISLETVEKIYNEILEM